MTKPSERARRLFGQGLALGFRCKGQDEQAKHENTAHRQAGVAQRRRRPFRIAGVQAGQQPNNAGPDAATNRPTL